MHPIWYVLPGVRISTDARSSLQAVESSMPAHGAIAGGCQKSAWSVDSKYLVSIAEDDSIAVFQTKYEDGPKAPSIRQLMSPCRYAGRLNLRAAQLPEDYHRKTKNLADLPTYENAPSALFDDIHDRFVGSIRLSTRACCIDRVFLFSKNTRRNSTVFKWSRLQPRAKTHRGCN